jgi:hypothetical protein
MVACTSWATPSPPPAGRAGRPSDARQGHLRGLPARPEHPCPAAVDDALAAYDALLVPEADPADKADIYAQLNLTPTYQPDQRLVEATVQPGLNMRRGFVSEGESNQLHMLVLWP